ncbi:MAG: 50S ribosomal protein L21e [Candidatus Methanomethyliaceae archaeon]|nr:50S ribosomal protein L21e [Candidatus Methanomethyliaceae archaeon]MDW7970463.1 50S ribosomal protein L21e [Nitrososphaerota archaeon]
MRHSSGYRSRTRKLLRRSIREKSNPITRILMDYNEGDRVVIKINPSFVKGMPHRRFHGKTGIIMGKRGRAYVVKVLMGDFEKTIITRPEHIVPLEGR